MSQLINVWVEHRIPHNEALTYQCDFHVEKGMRVMVPLKNRSVIGLVCETDVMPVKDVVVKSVIKVIDPHPIFDHHQFELLHHMLELTLSEPIVIAKTMLPTLLKPKTSKSHIVFEDWVKASDTKVALTFRQQEIFDWVSKHKEVSYTHYRQYAKSLSLKMIESGAIIRFQKEKSYMLPRLKVSDPFKALTQKQQEAYQAIDLENHHTYLLFGTTGSGKTEVYMHVVKDCLALGKSVYVLVPEVALTPQMIERFQSRFQEMIIIYHSGLSDNERYYQYQQARKPNPKIVIGTRSSIFLPIDDVGCIIMDEEHDLSFKQEVPPYYHARDIAYYKAIKHRCPLILGSATPSLESHARALKGVYKLLTLPQRINQTMAKITLVDMQKEIKDRKAIHISQTLIEAISDRLKKKEQVILLLNRRGYLPTIQCSHCFETAMCQYCDIPLTYHKEDKKLHCHGCGHVYHRYECPHCHHHAFMGSGLATQRLEEAMTSLFSEATIQRMDYDTTRQKDGHQQILDEFIHGNIDILIGTQMVAKGLDVPNVTLVGILYADAALSRNDYHVNETTFAMISQAAGRSGRHHIEGEVIIQAFDVDHYVIQAVIMQDYNMFFTHEMHYRKLAQLPPYVYLVSVVFSHHDQKKVFEASIKLKNESKQHDLQCLGPIDIGKASGQYRYRLVYKSKDLALLKHTLKTMLHPYQQQSYTVKINVSPLHLE